MPGRRRLADAVERRYRHFSRLCLGIIRDLAPLPRTRGSLGRAHAGQVEPSTGELARIDDAGAKLQTIKAQADSVSVADLFEMQVLMNHLSQLAEMATSVVSASNSAIASMARNIKS